MEFARLCDELGCDAAEGLQLVAPPADAEPLRKVAEPQPAYRTRRPARSRAGTET